MIAENATHRVGWVDYSKGICIVAVVCLYTTLHLHGAPGETSWMQYWVDFARPFRMPDFFLMAGLFLGLTLDRPWRVYLDRKVVHFAYFFVLWTTIYFVLRELQADHAADPHNHLLVYLSWLVEPFHMLWFIAILPVFFVVTRLLRNAPWYLVLAGAALLQILPIDSNVGQFDRFCERYVYFYAGYLFAPMIFRFAAWAAADARSTLMLLFAWAVVNQMLVQSGWSAQPVVALVLGFAGAAAVVAAGALLSRRRWANWLRDLGRNSIVVFLAFFLFVAVMGAVLERLAVVDDLGTRQLIAAVAGILGPVALFRVVRQTPLRFLFARPRWAQLAPAPQRADKLPEAGLPPVGPKLAG